MYTQFMMHGQKNIKLKKSIQLYGSCEYLEAVGQMWLVTTFRSPQCTVSWTIKSFLAAQMHVAERLSGVKCSHY